MRGSAFMKISYIYGIMHTDLEVITGIASGYQPKKCKLANLSSPGLSILLWASICATAGKNHSMPAHSCASWQRRRKLWSWEPWAEFPQKIQLQLYSPPQISLSLGHSSPRALSDCTPVAAIFDEGDARWSQWSAIWYWRDLLTSPAWAGVYCAYNNFPGSIKHAQPEVKHLHLTWVSSHASLSDRFLRQMAPTHYLQTCHFP